MGPSSSSHTATWTNRLRRLVCYLLPPDPPLSAADLRQRRQTLTALLPVAVVLNFVLLLVIGPMRAASLDANPIAPPVQLTNLAYSLMMLLGLWLSYKGYYWTAATLTLISAFVASFSTIIANYLIYDEPGVGFIALAGTLIFAALLHTYRALAITSALSGTVLLAVLLALPTDAVIYLQWASMAVGLAVFLLVMVRVQHRTAAVSTHQAEALHASQARLNAVIHDLAVALFVVDREGEIVLAEGKAFDAIGFKSGTLVGQSIYDTYYDGKYMVPDIARALLGYSFSTVRKFRTDLIYEIHYSPLHNTEGEVDGVIGVAVDITDRERAEQERDRFFMLSLDMLCIGDFDGYFVRLNPAFERTLGHAVGELYARPIMEFVHPDDQAETQAELERLHQGAASIAFVNRFRHHDGSYRWLSWNMAPYSEERLLYAVAHDITETKRFEAELRRREHLYRTLARNLPRSAVLLFDHDLRYLLAEGGELRPMGLAKEQVEGRNLFEVLPPESANELAEYYRDALAGHHVVLERQYNDQDYLIQMLPVTNEEGNIFAGLALSQNITERKQVEEALRVSEETLRSTIVSMTDLVFVLDREGIFLDYYQPVEVEALYNSPQDFIGQRFDAVLPRIVAKQLRTAVKIVAETQAVQQFDYPLEIHDHTLWFSAKVSARYDAEGALAGFTVVARNITERKQAEEALRKSEEQIVSMVTSMDALVFSVDLEGRFLFYYPSVKSIYDTPVYPADAYVGRPFKDVLPEDLSRNLDNVLVQVQKDLRVEQFEYVETSDGQERHFSARVSPFISPGIALIGYTVVASDITEAVHARYRQQNLLELEQLNHTITGFFLQSDDPEEAVGNVLELTGTFLGVSRVYVLQFRENERLLDSTHEWCAPGIEPQQHNMQGIAFDDIFPGLMNVLREDGLIVARHISDLPEDTRAVLERQGVQALLNIPFYVDGRLQGLVGYADHGHPREWLPEEVASIRAVAESYARGLERDRAGRALVEARDMALQSARLKSEFISNMSHEIRTPMTGVLGMLELLGETDLSETQRELARVAYGSATSLMEILNDILDFSKIEAGKIELEAEVVELRGLITEVQQTLLPQANKKPLEFLTDVGASVPRRILGDSTRLRQVLINLASNAIKFTEQGQVRIAVWQTGSVQGRARLHFAVTDSGIGISPEHVRSIFDSFVQADSSTTRRYGGTGLGLAISRQLVELMGGQLAVESELGQGSTFSFALTCQVVDEAEDEQTVLPFWDLRVLVLDNDQAARYLLRQQLGIWGITADELDRPDALLQTQRAAIAAGAPYDAVIFRCQGMAYGDQVTMITGLRHELGAAMPYLICLDDNGQPAPQDGLFDAHLPRPVRQDTLYDLLGTLVERRSAPPQKAEAVAQGGRILLVEDAPVNQQIVVTILRPAGYEVDVAEDGVQALEMVQAHDYALVLMDVQMPNMDGLTATRRIRALDGPGSQVVILALTASVLKKEQANCLEAGMNDVLTKPFTSEELRAAVRHWMPHPTPLPS